MNLEAVFKKFPKEQTYLIEILQTYQNAKPTHHLTEDELKIVAKHLDLPESHVFSVISFYSFFSMQPRGRYIIQFCKDIPCLVNDEVKLEDVLENLLEIKVGETTKDGLFTLEYSSCLGQCDNAPLIRINDKIYGHLTKNKLKAILTEYRSENNA